MSDSLRRLVKLGSFNILQDRLEEWSDSYHLNTCDHNIALGCEIIELNSKIQGQLFKLLNICASEGGVYGGAGALKSRLLPLLEKGFLGSGVSGDSNRNLMSEMSNGNQTTREIKRIYERSLEDLEFKLKQSKSENENLKFELDEAKQELERQGRQSSAEKMFDKREITDLKLELGNVKSENELLKCKATKTDQYEKEIEHLKDDVIHLTTCRSPSPCHDAVHGHCAYDHDHCDYLGHHHLHHHHHGLHHPHHHHHHQLHSDGSCCTLDDCTMHECHVKERNLVSRMNDLFSITRVDAMNTLRRYSEEHDNNQKIIFHAVMEAFNSARSAFRLYKSRIRTDTIGKTQCGMTLEESVQHYINQHGNHEADVTALIKEVVRHLDFKVPLIRRPNGLGFDVINSFIRESCKLAWAMCCLGTPLDVYHPASDGELFDEHKYRRSFDSDYTASFVSHHVWPCLTKSGLVVAKGEAVTRKAGYGLSSSRMSRSPARSPNRSSGRSLSPPPRRSSPVSTYRARSPTFRSSRKY